MHTRLFLLLLAPIAAGSMSACTQAPAVRWQAIESAPAQSVDHASRACVIEVEQRLLSMGPAESPVFIFGTTTSEAGLWGRVRKQELFDECMAAQGWMRSPTHS